MPDTVCDKQRPYTFNVGGDIKTSPQREFRSNVILVFRSSHEVVKRGVQIAVRREQPEIIKRIAFEAYLNTFVYKNDRYLRFSCRQSVSCRCLCYSKT